MNEIYQNIQPILFATAVVAGVFLVIKLLPRYLLAYAKKQPSAYTSIFLQRLIYPFSYFIGYLVILVAASNYLPDSKLENIIIKAGKILLIMFLAFLFLRALSAVEIIIYSKYNDGLDKDLNKRIARTQFQYIKKFLQIAIILLAAAGILMNFQHAKEFGVSLLASAGVITIILTFTAQTSLSRILSGFQLAFSQPIRIGDNVIVENEYGQIEEITLTYVVVGLWDKRKLILPVNYFLEKPFQNWTYKSSDLIGTVFLYLDYSFDINSLKNELDNILNSASLWDKKVKSVQVSDSKENCMEIRILVSADNAPDLWDLRCFVREKLIQFIQTNAADKYPHIRIQNHNPI